MTRLLPLLLLPVLLSGCSFEDAPGVVGPSPEPAASPEAQDPCTQTALALLDGLLNGVPSSSPEEAVRANSVVEEFVARYDQVIVASGVPAARREFAGPVAVACASLAPAPAPASVAPPVVESPQS